MGEIWKIAIEMGVIGVVISACSPAADDGPSTQGIASVSQALGGTVSLDIAAGSGHVCAIVSGGIQCWGANNQGQLGNGSFGRDSFTLSAVNALPKGVQNISSGSAHTCAVINGGAVCWGYNQHGQLGNAENPPHDDPNRSPVRVEVTGLEAGVQAISAGRFHTCAIVSGAVKCWGYNADRQLGVDALTHTNAFVQAGNLTSGVTDITAGGSHSCAIVNGTGVCWGLNDNGQLGNRVASAVPLPVPDLPSGVQTLSAGLLHTCALVNGGVQCWGSNSTGQLGNDAPSISASNKPAPVLGLTSGVQAIAAGASHTCALLTSGTVQCWGSNSLGELGAGFHSDIPSYRPVSVVGLPSNVRAIVVGASFSCAKADSGVWCWGANGNGQLAFNPNESSVMSSPVQVAGLSVAAGCADGTVEQVFGSGMVGCAGSVTFSNRATLCAPGFVPATAVQWMSNRGDAKPGHNYWTNDPLLRSGSGPAACFASTVGGNSCGSAPMRLCTATGRDTESNICEWSQCGLYANAPNQFFGGCNDSSTAGTVCIPSTASQIGCELQSCPKWENGAETSTETSRETTGILGTVRQCSQFCASAGHCGQRTCTGTASEPATACQNAANARLTALRSNIKDLVERETSFDSSQALQLGIASAQAKASVTTGYVLRSPFREVCGSRLAATNATDPSSRTVVGGGGGGGDGGDGGGGPEDPPCWLNWDEQLECVLVVATSKPVSAPNDACGCKL